MAGIGVDVEYRYFVKAIFRDRFKDHRLYQAQGQGAYAFDPRKLDNPSLQCPSLQIELLSNVVHLGVLGMVCWDQ